MSAKGSVEERRELLERRANAVRSRLLLAVDALDARRHRVEELGTRAKNIAVPALLTVAGVVALVGAAGIGIGWMLVQRKRRRIPERIKAAIRGLDLVRQPSFGRRVAEKIAISVATVLASALAKRAAGDMVAGRKVFGLLPSPIATPDVSSSPYPGPGAHDIVVRVPGALP